MHLDTNQKTPVLVAGALGKMGSEVIKAICKSSDCKLIGAIDNNENEQGKDIGIALGINELEIPITSDLEGSLCLASQTYRDATTGNGAVLVDFTHPNVVYDHVRAAIAYGVNPVIGTTGLTSIQIKELSDFAEKSSIGTAIIPNFSVGMVLLQQAVVAASGFYDHVELIESHHNQKADAPSGTCIKTAELAEELSKTFNDSNVKEHESLKGCRGGLSKNGIRIHSIRLPGIVAQQQVIFGSSGETYTLCHNTIDRSAYMPGVLLVISKVRRLESLVYGLEKLL
ncbi:MULTISPECIES: 4-hydroxy-tetrahydrodipicolinate reductase [unclassified Prochlorococcus]|uniref:4-hydroxy-tetrahydrodipicolinate reductase n=1 Tax=unclassified Prochlorococcus TaxID=2627481 RepID=UPI000533AF44|nr:MULTISPECIES: 4-hydroxy-tetrahydrodipicolinate reductase [unclassified Prochlorococcus]KGG15224.1 Dihydrodipicolinate reductase [Prochlorococcus sp. MIT 0602]KGG17499.1 Dihydrodipicolinate reductase [Prochlorococcus sp. MIT 0603]